MSDTRQIQSNSWNMVTMDQWSERQREEELAPKKLGRPFALPPHGASHASNSALAARIMPVLENWRCGDCGKAFESEYKLVRHKKTHLKGDARRAVSHCCPQCTYSSLQKSNLVVHMRTHTKERPFSCPTCFQTFSDPANVLHHRQRMHGYVKRYRRPNKPSGGSSSPEDSSRLHHRRDDARHSPYYASSRLPYDSHDRRGRAGDEDGFVSEESYTDDEEDGVRSDSASSYSTSHSQSHSGRKTPSYSSSPPTTQAMEPQERRRQSFWEVVMDR